MMTRNSTARWLEKYQRWQVNVRNAVGQRKTFTSSAAGRKGQTECNRKADEWLSSCAIGPDTRCDRLMDAWLKQVELHTGRSNYLQRKSIAENWMKPYIGSVKFSRLTKASLQSVIDAAYSEGKSKKHLMNIRGALSSWLQSCPDTGLMRLTTAEIVIPSGAPEGERHILQPNELFVLLNDSSTVRRGKSVDEWYVNAWRLAVVTGYRPGELIALERKHWHDGRLLVRGAVNAHNEKTRGKNDNAIRDTVLPSIGNDILMQQELQLKRAGVLSRYLFPTPDGSCAAQNVMYNHWIAYRTAHGIQSVTPYELRHTFVSVTSGMSDVTLSELKDLVGHSRNMDTLGTYAHKVNAAEKHLSGKIDNAFARIIRDEMHNSKNTAKNTD